MDIFAILLIIIILYLLKNNRKKDNVKSNEKTLHFDDKLDHQFPYKKYNSLLTKAEQNFFLVLSIAIIDENYYICPKVRLADIIQVDDKNNYQSYFNKIKSKHIDYIICEKTTFKIKYAIELDDITHNLEHRIKRDDFILNALSNADIELIRFNVNYTYKVSEIKEKLNIKY